jgi:outer membrane protein OmpA-like peptidoglycan-associated protein
MRDMRCEAPRRDMIRNSAAHRAREVRPAPESCARADETECMRIRPLLLIAAIVSIASRPARSSPWVTGELPAAFAVSSPQDSYFRPGAMPSLAVFVPVASHAAVGLRMRFGMLGNGSSHPVGVADPGPGGLLTGGVALRLDEAATWLELDGGGGLTGFDVVPAWEIGVGHDFVVGDVAVGPMARFVRVMGADPMPMIDRGPASIVLFGVEARTGVHHRPHLVVDVVQAPPAPELDHDPIAVIDRSCVGDDGGAGCPPSDRDADGIADAADKCPDDPETVNGVEDEDGCPDHGEFEVKHDRIVLDERVLFDVNRARIKHGGKHVIAAIAQAWRVHPEWGFMEVEGHCDVRGPDAYNDWLSNERAARVREALVEAGLPPDRITSIGYGKSRPVDPGMTEEAHQRNRRVEFAITRVEGGVR